MKMVKFNQDSWLQNRFGKKAKFPSPEGLGVG